MPATSTPDPGAELRRLLDADPQFDPVRAVPTTPVIVCPQCGARTGQPCVNTRTGKPFTGFTHRERRKAALREN